MAECVRFFLANFFDRRPLSFFQMGFHSNRKKDERFEALDEAGLRAELELTKARIALMKPKSRRRPKLFRPPRLRLTKPRSHIVCCQRSRQISPNNISHVIFFRWISGRLHTNACRTHPMHGMLHATLGELRALPCSRTAIPKRRPFIRLPLMRTWPHL